MGLQVRVVNTRSLSRQLQSQESPVCLDLFQVGFEGQHTLATKGVHLGVDALPAWSPDGSRIAFNSDRGDYLEIYVMNADGSGQTSLTDNSGSDRSPSWGSARDR